MSPKVAKTIAKETGANAKMLNPLEGLSNKNQSRRRLFFRNETKSRCDQRGIKRMSESNTKQMIQLNHVKFGYSDTEVLEEINLTIHEGEYVVLTGENGSGKSTLMRLILGEMKPDEGEIILMNNDPRLKKQIGYVSQNGISKNQSFPATVEEIMITGLYQELGLFHLPHKNIRIRSKRH